MVAPVEVAGAPPPRSESVEVSERSGRSSAPMARVALLLGAHPGLGFEDVRVARGRVADGVRERGHLPRRRRVPGDVERGLGHAHRGGEDALGHGHARLGPHHADGEARQVGLGARQHHRRAQPRVDAGPGEIAVHPRPPLGVLGGAEDRFRAEDREVGLLDAEVDVEVLDRDALPDDVDERVGGRGAGGDAAEVEDLLVDAGAEEGRRIGPRRAGGRDLGATDAKHVDEGRADVGAGAVVGGRGEPLCSGPDRGEPLRTGDAGLLLLRGDARHRGADRRLVGAREGERLGQGHDSGGRCIGACLLQGWRGSAEREPDHGRAEDSTKRRTHRAAASTRFVPSAAPGCSPAFRAIAAGVDRENFPAAGKNLLAPAASTSCICGDSRWARILLKPARRA